MTFKEILGHGHRVSQGSFTATTTGNYQPERKTRRADTQWLRVAYDAGAYARIAGCRRQACPYYIADRTPGPPVPMSAAAAEWFRGWDDAELKGSRDDCPTEST